MYVDAFAHVNGWYTLQPPSSSSSSSSPPPIEYFPREVCVASTADLHTWTLITVTDDYNSTICKDAKCRGYEDDCLRCPDNQRIAHHHHHHECPETPQDEYNDDYYYYYHELNPDQSLHRTEPPSFGPHSKNGPNFVRVSTMHLSRTLRHVLSRTIMRPSDEGPRCSTFRIGVLGQQQKDYFDGFEKISSPRLEFFDVSSMIQANQSTIRVLLQKIFQVVVVQPDQFHDRRDGIHEQNYGTGMKCSGEIAWWFARCFDKQILDSL